MITVLVGEEDAIELARCDPALFEAADKLARAQAAIDQEPAVIGRHERAISSAAAAEHGQCEHASISSGRALFSQIGNEATNKFNVCFVIVIRAAKGARNLTGDRNLHKQVAAMSSRRPRRQPLGMTTFLSFALSSARP